MAAALAEIRKLLVAAAAVLAAVIASGLLHGQAEAAAETAIAVLGLFGVYATPNGQSDIEKRIADLEATVPGLPDLVDAIGVAIGKALKPKPSPFPPPAAAALQPVSLPAGPQPQVVIPAEAVQAVGQEVVRQLQRDQRGRFTRKARP